MPEIPLRGLTIMFSNSTTLAQRIDAQTAKGLFCGKLLNYDRDDFDSTVADVNSTATDYSLVSMNPTAHMNYGTVIMFIRTSGSHWWFC